jgi:hypothetical protein
LPRRAFRCSSSTDPVPRRSGALDFSASYDLFGGKYTTPAGGEVYQTWNWEDFQVALAENTAGKFLYVNPYNPGEIGNLSTYINAVGHDIFFFIQASWDSEVSKGYGYYV